MVSNAIIAIVLIGLSSLISGANSVLVSHSLWRLVSDRPLAASPSMATIEWMNTNDTVSLKQCSVDLATTHAKLDKLSEDVKRGFDAVLKSQETIEYQSKVIYNSMHLCMAGQKLTADQLSNFETLLDKIKLSLDDERHLRNSLSEAMAQAKDEAAARARTEQDFRESTKYDKYFLAIRLCLTAVMVTSIFDPVHTGESRSITAASFGFYAFVPVGIYGDFIQAVVGAYAVLVALYVSAVTKARDNVSVMKMTKRMNRMETNVANTMETMLHLINSKAPPSPPAQTGESSTTATAVVDENESDDESSYPVTQDMLDRMDGRTTTKEGESTTTNPWILRGPGSVRL